MSTQPQMIQSAAMPPQVAITMPAGSKGPGDAAIKISQQQTTDQMALIGKTSGGSRRRKSKKHMRGGETPVVQVPPVSSGAVNPQQTGANYKGLTELAQTQQTQSSYDKAQNPGDTAAIQSQQQAIYAGTTGGSSKKGGYWPVWGCLSGGKKTKRTKKSKSKRNRKNKKNKKTKRRHH